MPVRSSDIIMELVAPIPYYQTFTLLLLQGLPLYADVTWRLATHSTPDGGFLSIVLIVFYALFCFQHPSYSADVIRMGQTGFYFAEWATATYSLQYWYASERFNVGYIVAYSIFSFVSMTTALACHHDIRIRTPQHEKSISHPNSPRIAPAPAGNIQQLVAPFRSLYELGNPVQPYQQIV